MLFLCLYFIGTSHINCCLWYHLDQVTHTIHHHLKKKNLLVLLALQHFSCYYVQRKLQYLNVFFVFKDELKLLMFFNVILSIIKDLCTTKQLITFKSSETNIASDQQ